MESHTPISVAGLQACREIEMREDVLKASETKRYFQSDDTVATWWNPESSSSRHLYAEEIRHVEHALSDVVNGRVLDAACGKGRASAGLGTRCSVIGLDISRQMLEEARGRFPMNALIQGDSEQLPFVSETFDVVICLEALVHIPVPQKALNEFVRVLKPGGRLVISIDQHRSLYVWGRWISQRLNHIFNPTFRLDGEGIWRPLATQDICAMLQAARFRLLKVEYIGVLAPVWITFAPGKQLALISPAISRRLSCLSRTLDRLYGIQNLAKYALIIMERQHG